eukprot:4614434-Alexandrium_andersonii.AAC.1
MRLPQAFLGPAPGRVLLRGWHRHFPAGPPLRFRFWPLSAALEHWRPFRPRPFSPRQRVDGAMRRPLPPCAGFQHRPCGSSAATASRQRAVAAAAVAPARPLGAR